ncbi:uncharacterized protein LOC132194837 [Neocloeon triangulifer]|uniref:uncharacterized protein LOC132194837 n=1 Tax=Neocloeon triangulifer TaxID=2078957 RepID=UPI00286EBB06|nr:uncharacterized protein LOC132194837 [Neocloeon triangulifer]
MNSKVVVLLAVVAVAICAPADHEQARQKRGALSYPYHYTYPLAHHPVVVHRPIPHVVHPVSYANYYSNAIVNPYTGLAVRFGAAETAPASSTAAPETAPETAADEESKE